MKTKITIILTIFTLLMLTCLIGCQTTTERLDKETTEKIENNKTIQGSPAELIDKRGKQTNITEINELMIRASIIDSFQYNLIDTNEKEINKYYVRGRFYRVSLEKTLESNEGNVFSEVYMERTTKTALSRCDINVCGSRDMEFDIVDYDYFYKADPYETMTKFVTATFIGEDMIGNDYVKIFSGKFEGNNATMYVQEYWGYPIKIEYDDKSRTIEFSEMEIDTVKMGEIQLPFNCTINGKEGKWWTWEHYLGEMKPGKVIDMSKMSSGFGA